MWRSSTVRHLGNFAEAAGVDRERATVVRGVFYHGPHDVANRLATHDGTWGKRGGELFGSAGAEELDGVRIAGLEHLTCVGEGGHGENGFGHGFEIEIEAFRTRGAFDEPVECVSSVGDLLGDGHHAFARGELGVGFLEDAGGAIEEVFACEKLF